MATAHSAPLTAAGPHGVARRTKRSPTFGLFTAPIAVGGLAGLGAGALAAKGVFLSALGASEHRKHSKFYSNSSSSDALFRWMKKGTNLGVSGGIGLGPLKFDAAAGLGARPTGFGAGAEHRRLVPNLSPQAVVGVRDTQAWKPHSVQKLNPKPHSVQRLNPKPHSVQRLNPQPKRLERLSVGSGAWQSVEEGQAGEAWVREGDDWRPHAVQEQQEDLFSYIPHIKG